MQIGKNLKKVDKLGIIQKEIKSQKLEIKN